MLGRPLIPWQRHVADVAGELLPGGRYRYLRVVVIVPRRAGKTHVALAKALTVTRARPASRAFYAAHRRETAAAMWRDDWFPTVELSPLHPRYIALRRSNGSEAMTWRHCRSTFRLLPPDGDAMRSFASDLAIIDEAREFGIDQGMDFELAAFPTQATGLGGQTWIMSNAGRMSSDWLRRWRDLGRAATTDPDSRIAYFEWCAPDGADPADEATWWAAHPGLGYHVNVDALRADQETMDPDGFAAEYLGWWPETRIDTELVDAWQRCELAAAAAERPLVFALELDEERTRLQIVVCGRDPGTGRPTVELLCDRAHGTWVTAEVTRLAREHRPRAIVWDAAGPVGALAPDLEAVPANLVGLGTRDVIAAAGAAHDAVLAGVLAHRPDDVLTAGVVAARHRRAGGAWLYDRRQPGVGPWIAATLAAWHYRSGQIAPPTAA